MAAAGEADKHPTVSAEESGLWPTIRNLWGYMWPKDRPDLKWRVVLAIGALLISKVATTLVPFAYKGIVDSLDTGSGGSALVLGLAVPIVLLVRSVIPMVRGEWRDKARLEAAATSGFIGMLTIPLALTVTFLIGG